MMRLEPEDIQSPESYESNEEAIAWYLYYLLHQHVLTNDELYGQSKQLYNIEMRL